MNDPNILAIDVGTSEVKTALVSHAGKVLDCARSGLRIIHPEPTWAEQDPNAWWHAICAATRELWRSTSHSPQSVSSVVFSCQMFGVLPVDADQKPLMNAMIWLDTRSRDQARAITSGFPKIAGYGLFRTLKWLRQTNGAPALAGRDTVSKLIWLREERPEVWQRTHKVLDVKDYLLMRCSGRSVTTHDLASGSWLYRTKKGELGWSQPILDMLELTTEKLPEVVRSTEVVGELLEDAASDLGIPAGVPVVAGAGDVPSCAVGTGAVRTGEAHAYIGTSSWIAAHLDNRAVHPFAATGTLCAAEEDKYLLIATQETAGASLEWVRNNMLPNALHYDQINDLVDACEPGAGGAFFFPWLMGERVPKDDSSLRAGFVNLSLSHDRSHLLRAVYEGVAYNSRWALGPVERLMRKSVPRLRIAGGGAKSDPWCQIMADVLGRPIEQVANPQYAGVRGAALIALRALGEVARFEDTSSLVTVRRTFEPNENDRALHDDRFAAFKRFYKQNHAWFRVLNEGRRRR
jgi:xylulokinase